MMKKYMTVACALLAATVIVYSCSKQQQQQQPLTEEQAVQTLVSDAGFIDFSKSFIRDFAELMQYHRAQPVLANKEAFLARVQNSNGDETQINAAYTAFSINYDHAVLLKNKIDNDILQLLGTRRFLLSFPETKIQSVIFNAIDAGLQSTDPRWQETRTGLETELKQMVHRSTVPGRSIDAIGLNYKEAELSLEEVWTCLKHAVGLGTAGVLGISGLAQLAKEGVQAAVINVSKWIAKRAGWFGIAIMAIDFGVCVYNEATD